MSDFKWVGTRTVRPDGLAKVTGRALYGADRSEPGMLYGYVLRSPHPHARIVSIDISEAKAITGVHSVITGADFPDLEAKMGVGAEYRVNYRDLSHNVIARDKVLYVGHAVAAVAASTYRIAEEAAKAIEVQYEVLPHVMTTDAAMAKDAVLLYPDRYPREIDSFGRPGPEIRSIADSQTPGRSTSDRLFIDEEDLCRPSNIAGRALHQRGNLEDGFSIADVVLEREFTTPMVHQGYIEPHAVLADTDEDGKAVIWCSSQGHFLVRSLTARILGWDPSRLRVIPAEIGGGFGGKTTIYLEPIAVLLSHSAGRPVKLTMRRDEVFMATGPTSGATIMTRIGAKSDGTITAAHARLVYEAGGFPGSSVNAGCMTMFASYKIPNLLIEGYDVVVNKPKVHAYRAPGAPQAAFAAESVIDDLARALGMDALEIRLMNAVTEGDATVNGSVFKRIGFKETLLAIRDHPHYSAPLGPNQGRGIASGFWFNGGLSSSATVMLNEDGTANVVTGSPDIGGSRASIAHFAAEELGIDPSRIRTIIGDTESVGFTSHTGGSRVTLTTGMAVVRACRDVVSELCADAARIWEVPAKEVYWKDGSANHESGLHDPLSLEELCFHCAASGKAISKSVSLDWAGVGVTFSTQVCDVEVDPDTGRVAVVRVTAAQDAGRAIHPSYVEGQIQGGVVQGLGWALNEEYVFSQSGEMVNPGFLDYRMPVASDLPMIDTVVVEVPNPDHPYGVRGVGECSIIPPLAAVANAVRDATGSRVTTLPLTPARVLAAMESPEKT